MQAPFDDGRVGELNDDAVGHPAGRAQRLRSVTGDPDGQFVLGPFQPDLDPVIADLSPGCQVADQPAVGLHLLDAHRLLPEDPPGAVPPADPHHHPAPRDLVQGGERAGGHRGIAGGGVGDAGTDLDAPGIGRHQGEDRVDLLPEHVRVEEPRVLEALGFGELGQIHPPARGRIRSKTNAEAQPCH